MEIAEDWQTAEKRYLTFSEENAVGDNRNYRKNVA
jgi:hypothetical protein